MLRHVLAGALLLTAATDQSSAQTGLETREQAQLDQSLKLGLKLYRYDQSAWHVTDAALPALSDDAKKIARGYVTTPAPNGLKTTFFGEVGGNYIALYSAVWTGSAIAEPQVYPPGRLAPLSDEERRLILARKIAIDSGTSMSLCSSSPPNIIVVPSSNDETVHVYVLTSQTKAETYAFGGHNRIDVKYGKIVTTRKFANSCLTMSTKDAPEEARALGFYVTHLLDPVPTEIHVFNALMSRTMIMVGTNLGKRVFAVEPRNGQPTITMVESDAKPGRKR